MQCCGCWYIYSIGLSNVTSLFKDYKHKHHTSHLPVHVTQTITISNDVPVGNICFVLPITFQCVLILILGKGTRHSTQGQHNELLSLSE